MLSFKAHCARNHDRIDFTDPQAFESHMATEHGKRKSHPGAPMEPLNAWGYVRPVGAPGWRNGKPSQPYPWKAPSVPKDWQARLEAVLREAEGRRDGIRHGSIQIESKDSKAA